VALDVVNSHFGFPQNLLWHFSWERTTIYVLDQQTALLAPGCETNASLLPRSFPDLHYDDSEIEPVANQLSQIQADPGVIEISVIEGDGVCNLDG
jgi:hypothetical protein